MWQITILNAVGTQQGGRGSDFRSAGKRGAINQPEKNCANGPSNPARQKMAKGGHVLWCAGYDIKRPFMCMVSHVVNMLDRLLICGSLRLSQCVLRW